MTEEEKKRLREALAGAKNAGSWKTPVVSAPKQTASVSSDRQRRPAEAPKVASVGGISEGSEYNRGSISELRKNYATAPKAAETKVAAVGDSAFAGVTGFNKGLTGILGAAADLVDPMYKFIEEQSFYQGAPAWSQKAIDLVTGRMAQQNLKKTADYYKKSDEEAQTQVQKNIEAGHMGEIGNALIQGTVQAVPSVAAAWMGAGVPTASAGLAGTVNGTRTGAQMMGSAVKEMASKPQFILSAAQSFGGAYDEALAKGADTGEAITAAVLTAFPEAMIESMGGTEKLVEKIAGEAGRKGVKGAIQDILQNMAEEGLEELVQYPVGKMAAIGYDPDMKLYSTTEEAVINPVEMGKAAAMGAAIGGIMGGGAKVGDVAVGKTVSSVGDMMWTERLGKEIRDQDGGTALIRAAMESGDGKLQTEAERLTGKLQQGEKLTNRELADLYQAEVDAGIDTYTEEEIVKRALTRPETVEDPLTQVQREVEETERKQKTLREYLGAVDKGIMQFIQDVRAGRPKTKKPHTIGAVSERTAEGVKAVTGVDVAEFEHKLTADAVRHITKRHGVTGEADHSMSNDADVARIGYVLEQYDSVDYTRDEQGNVVFSDMYQNSDQSKAPMITFVKQIDGRRQYVIEAVPDSKRKSLWIVSAYANGSVSPEAERDAAAGIKKEGAQPSDEVKTSPDLTSETSAVSSFDTSIPQEAADSQALRFGNTVPTQVVNRAVGETLPGQATGEVVQALKKGEDIRTSEGNAFLREVRKSLGVPETADAKGTMRSLNEDIIEEVRQTGGISKEAADRLFGAAWERGSVVMDDYYQQYKSLKEDILRTPVSITEGDARNVPDYGYWRRKNQGNVKISADGVPVDVRYEELSRIHPELFPDDITHPADQLMRIAEVSAGIRPQQMSLDELDEGYADAARLTFDEALAAFADRIRYTFDAEQRTRAGETPVPDRAVLEQSWNAKRQAQAERDRLTKKIILTPADEKIAMDVASGKRTAESVPEGPAKRDILALAEAEAAVIAADAPIQAYKRARAEQKQEAMEDLLKESDSWTDKKTGLAYSTETMERNIRDISKNSAEGKRLIETVFTPIHQNEAGRQRMIRQYKQQIAALGLTREESAWVQMVGEGVRKIEAVPQTLDKEKIEQAVTLMRDQIYPDLLRQVNNILLKNGYEPVKGIENYFPHFQNEDDPLVKAFGKLGMKVQTDALPTSIAGTTHTFRPGKQWVGNFLHRVSDKTEYDALAGFDRYIEGVSSVIWHTDDIQNLRALETAIRRKYSDEGLQQRVDAIRRDGTLSEQERDEQLSQIFQNSGLTNLSKFVGEVRKYTDTLAGKKSIHDRGVEDDTNRSAYSIAKALEGRVAANMVALNPGSWITNVIPLTQALAEVDPAHLVLAMTDTIKARGADDGFADRSTFLTNRRGSEALSKTGLEKITDALSRPMQAIDNFTSETIARAFYDQNIRRGMDPDTAMDNADQRTAGLMADRSKGALPTIFERKNPVTKVFTMFQTEVNNQMSWMFKDLPEEYKGQSKLKVAGYLAESALAAWLYNELYEMIIGRRPAFDVIGMVTGIADDFTATDEEGNKKKSTAQAITDTVATVGGQLPFIGGLLDGGRVPISSALPDAEKLWKGIGGLKDGTMAPNAAWGMIGKEFAKPVGYLAFPIGYGQLKKGYEGIKAWAEGGSYSTKSDGSREMQFPVEQNFGNFVKGALFGKSSFAEAQDYYDGFRKTTDLSEDGKFEQLWRQWFPEKDDGRDYYAEDLIQKYTPRIVKWSVTDEEGLKTGRRVELSRKEQKQYQAYYAEYLAEGVGSLAEGQQQKLREYAREMSTRRILGDVGEEYAVKDWVAEAAQAEEAGVGIKTYIGLQEIFAGIEPDKDEDGKTVVTSTEKKRAALMEREDLTAEQKNLIDRLLIQSEDSIKEVDYSSAASLQYTALDSAERARVDSIRTAFPGMSVDSVDKYRGICESGSKREKLGALQAEGMSEADAVLFYRLNGTAADKVDLSSREAAIRSTMSADEKVRASAAAYAVKGITEEQYLVYTALLGGTKEENKAALVKKGLSESQAEKLLRVAELKETDDVKSWNDVVYATMSDSQRTKLSQLQEYYPKATAADFDVCYQIYQSTKADKNAAGKTISGSKKKKVIAKLMEKGLGYNAALTFYNLMG